MLADIYRKVSDIINEYIQSLIIKTFADECIKKEGPCTQKPRHHSNLLDTLAQYGYTPNEWHRIGTEVNAAGDFILTSTHEYMPPGAQFGYERRMATDFEAILFWDEDASWFGIKRLM